MKMRQKLTDWQKQGLFFIILSAIIMFIGMIVENIYIEVLFGAIFIVSTLATRINIEFMLLKEK